MTSTIPAAFDYLVGLARQSVSSVPGAVAADGWTDEKAPTMFGVGIDAPPFFDTDSTDVTGTPSWDDMGGRHIHEDFTLPCYIYVGEGGTDNKTVRLAAFAIWDAFLALFRPDPTLGRALGDHSADLTNLRVSSPRRPEEAQGGRYCLIQFDVHCTALL